MDRHGMSLDNLRNLVPEEGCAKFRIRDEQALLKALQASESRSEKLLEENKKLQAVITGLELRLARLEGAANDQLSSNSQTMEPEFYTDEEELARETDWIVANKTKRESKKRKASNSPQATQSKPQTVRPKAIPPTQTKTTAPAPIYANLGQDVTALTSQLRTLKYKGKITAQANGNGFKLNCTDGDEYRQITHWLNENKLPWHTFSDKQSRPLKVMARGLAPDTCTDDIVQDLKSQEFKIISATNILSPQTKEKLRLFMLTFEHEQDVQAVYEIRRIEYQTAKIEELRKKSNKIVQCKNCQEYNHTRNFCRKAPRCVKCAGAHDSSTCQKPKEDDPKCVNCKEKHTANYRGCIVAKELQKIRNQSVKTTTANKAITPRPTTVQHRPTVSTNTNEKSYAQATGGKANLNPDTRSSMDRMEKFLQMQERFNQMMLTKFAGLEIMLTKRPQN